MMLIRYGKNPDAVKKTTLEKPGEQAKKEQREKQTAIENKTRN